VPRASALAGSRSSAPPVPYRREAVTHSAKRPLTRWRAVDDCLWLELANDPAELKPSRLLIRDFLQPRGVNARALFKVELVFEEAFTNIVRHGYDDGREHTVQTSIALAGDDVVLTFDDDGSAFNPLAVEAPAKPASLEAARLGGLGVMLMRKYAKRIEYAREAGRNRLTVHVATR